MARTRAHHQEFVEPGTEETEAGQRSGPLGLGRLVDLQSPMGNAAVAAMLQGRGDRSLETAPSEAPAPRGERHGKERFPYQFEMESLFGERFSDIDVELGASDRLDSMQADGAVAGGKVLFGTASPSRELVAHELAHVVQQRTHGGHGAEEEGRVSGRRDEAEKEADRTATKAARGERVRPTARPTPGAVHRSSTDRQDHSGTLADWKGPDATMLQWEGGNGSQGDAFLDDASNTVGGIRVMVRWRSDDAGTAIDLVRRAKQRPDPVRTYVTLTMGASDWTGKSTNPEWEGIAGPGYLPSNLDEQRAVVSQFVAWCDTVLKGLVGAGVFPDDVSVMNEPNLAGQDITDAADKTGEKSKPRGWLNIHGLKGSKENKRKAKLYASMCRRVRNLVEKRREEYKQQTGDGSIDTSRTGMMIGDLALSDSAISFLKALIASAKASGKPIVADGFAVHPYLPRASKDGKSGITRGKELLRRLERLLRDKETRKWLHTKGGKRLHLSFTEYARTLNGLDETSDSEADSLQTHLEWEKYLKAFAEAHDVKDFVFYGPGYGDVSPSDQDPNHPENPNRTLGWVNPIGDSLPSTASPT